MAKGTKAKVKSASMVSKALPDKADAATALPQPSMKVKPKPSHFKRTKGY